MSAVSYSNQDRNRNVPGDPEKFSADAEIRGGSISYEKGEDILGQQDVDPALNAKMYIVNNVRCRFFQVLLQVAGPVLKYNSL